RSIERRQVGAGETVEVRAGETEAVDARPPVLDSSYVAALVLVGQGDVAAKHAGGLGPILLAGPLEAEDVRAGLDAEAAKAVGQDLAVALVSRALQIPLLQREPLAGRRQPATIPAAAEPCLLEQLLRSPDVIRIAGRHVPQQRFEIVDGGVTVELAVQAVAARTDRGQ